MVVRTTSEEPTTFPEEMLVRYADQVNIGIAYFASGNVLRENADAVGPIGLAVSKRANTWIAQLNYIPFNCAIKPLRTDSRIVTIDWGNPDNTPLVRLRWSPGFYQYMRVYFIVQTWFKGAKIMSGKHHVVTLNTGTGTMHHLPCGNLYEDCTLCTGEFTHDSSSQLGYFLSCLQQFLKSPWNGDLQRKTDAATSMFRFTPTGEDLLQADLPDDCKWTDYCDKVSTASLTEFKAAITCSTI